MAIEKPDSFENVELPVEVIFVRRMDSTNKIVIPFEFRNIIGLQTNDFVRFKVTNTESDDSIDFIQVMGVYPSQIRIKDDVRAALDLYSGKSATLNKPLRVEILSVRRPVYIESHDVATPASDSHDPQTKNTRKD